MVLLVRGLDGPAEARVGDDVVYRVRAFNRGPVEELDAGVGAGVHWLVKAADGGALAHLHRHGPELRLTVPASWAGTTASVMPYLRSPSMRVAVHTRVPAAPPVDEGDPVGEVAVEVEREGRRYYAAVDGAPRIFVGADVAYGGRRGLMNFLNPPGAVYRPQDHQEEHGPWAWYLLPTARAESRGAFSCLNTYDRAAFTFGFLQYAAHTPRRNFVLLLRQLLALPLARAYLPELTVHGGRVCRSGDDGDAPAPLETDTSTADLQAWLNPSPEAVDDLEAERAARFVGWCVRDPAVAALQVSFAVRDQQRRLAHHATRLPLDGLTDKLVLVVLDILHQGRARYRGIRRRLAAADPFDALLTLGSSTYRERIATLRAAIRELEAAGRVGHRVYEQASGRFVEPEGV